MRRAILLLAMMGFGVMVVTGVALAANINCTGSATGTNGNDFLMGGQFSNDRCAGGGGNDTINGRQGNDRLFGDFGTDFLNGGPGDDLLNVADVDATVDTVDGGQQTGSPGDICILDAGDRIVLVPGGTATVPVTLADDTDLTGGTPVGTCEIVEVVF